MKTLLNEMFSVDNRAFPFWEFIARKTGTLGPMPVKQEVVVGGLCARTPEHGPVGMMKVERS
jgi:hypothetical protein